MKDRIAADIKAAMKAGDKARVGALRLVMAGIRQKEIDDRAELDDASIVALLGKMAKQRRESIEQYEKAGRDDLRDKEQYELDLINAYLPAPLSEGEIDALIERAVAETGAAGMKDMGKVMAAVKSAGEGRIDMSAVSARVRAKLQG